MESLKAKVVKIQGKYMFSIENFKDEYKIYYSSNNNMNGKELLVISNKEEIYVECPRKNRRLFFEVINENGATGVFSTRLVDVRTIDNFRDLGGYITQDGKTVKWGYFYRCASLGRVSQGDKNYLENMGLATIFDFRSKMEVEAEADIELDHCKYINESGISNMDNALQNKENFDMSKLIMEVLKKPEMISELENFIIGGYKTMVEQNNAFKIFFDNIKDSERLPLVFHCTAGKDRTGVAGALLLLALGVSEEKVIEDYTLSNFYRAAINELQIDKVKNYIKDEKKLDSIRSMFMVKESYLEVTLNEIKRKYDTYEEYITSELGVSREGLETLKSNYLF